MDPNEILKRILRRYGILTENFRALQQVESRIRKRIATYADAQDAAIQIGKALNTALKENLPDALTDGRLFRAVAEVVVEHPMKAAGRDVAKYAEAIQRELNENAGIGISPIVPEMNQDQINGIITGICNADSYEAGKGTMFAQVENALEGYVDDFVRENADFQYKAGLSPTIERRSDGKCCEWCSRLVGSYPYVEVNDRGNDVFRRHKHCHCLILYNPGNGSRRRQNVNTKKWTDEGKADRIKLSETPKGQFHERVYNSELPNGLPLMGTPNSISDKLSDDGKVLQRRKYGPDGKAEIDYDTTDHNRPDLHPTGAHKHIFDYSTGKPVRSKKNYPLTKEELQLNADIIIPGVNYHDKTGTY